MKEAYWWIQLLCNDYFFMSDLLIALYGLSISQLRGVNLGKAPMMPCLRLEILIFNFPIVCHFIWDNMHENVDYLTEDCRRKMIPV